MKGRSSYPHSIVSLMVAILLVTGCTHILKTSDFSTLQTGSPLRGVPSKTFAFKEFKRVRNVDDPALVAQVGAHTLVLDQPITTFVANQIRKELERNGHKFVNISSDVKADFIVEGSIYDFTYRVQQRLFSTNQTAHTGVKIMISCIPTEKGVFMKSYEGAYTTGGGLAGWKSSLNQALVAMIKEISTDTELVEFIKK
ncbi:hypothetical protein ISS37_11235 [candidate division KSB1 bacterium]|nr:hypothetical protein [candidate division KSB1 bacterium]